MVTKKIFLLVMLLALLLTSGCSGYSSKYGCNGMPDGIRCKSVSEVYTGESRGGVKKEEASKCGWWGCKNKTEEKGGLTKDDIVRSLGQNMLGMPIRTQPTQMRVWIAPWIDADGDLHDAEFIYVEVDRGKWEIGSIQGEGDNADNGTIINPKPPKNLPKQEQKANDTATQQQTVPGSSKQPAFPTNLNNLKPAR